MKLKTRVFTILLIFVMLLSGCDKQNASDGTSNSEVESEDKVSVPSDDTNDKEVQSEDKSSLPSNGSSSKEVQSEDKASLPSNVSIPESDSEMLTDRDYSIDYEDKVVNITLNGDSVSSDSGAVNISGTTVQLTEEATYVITGTLQDGSIVVNAADTAKLQIVLKGASITSATSAPLYILEADKVFVTLEEGTDNTLANGGQFIAIDDNNIDGTVFSKQDLTFNGSGSLTVTSPAGHGIVCKDDLVFTGGTYTVNSASHAIAANDSVRITNTTMSLDAGKDGIHVENSDDASLGFVYILDGTFHIEAEGDGISAVAYLQILGGNFNITTGGGSENGAQQSSGNYGGFMGGGKMGDRPGRNQFSTPSTTTTNEEESTSMKGIKSAGNLQIAAGSYTINSADDAVHSDRSVNITAGDFQVASGDDAFHAEETLTISGGTINITESYEGLEALDIRITGGDITLVASDDGLNAAGGTDSSGMGGRDQMFGGGGMGGGMMSSGNGSIVISDGTMYITASGDGIDANGTLEITGGHITVCGPTQGDTATLDYDKTATISGATFIGTGSSMMAQSITGSGQGVVAVSVGSQTAGTEIVLKDSSGNTVLTHTPELPYEVIILSSPDIIKGETYTITVGTQSGTLEAS